MASKSWVTHLMLIAITWRESVLCNGIKVDPPKDLMIVDPGHLGHLEIRWSAPASLSNMTQCSKMYHLEYFNTYKKSWTAVRTTRMTYSAQFDLMKDIQVRVYTLLSGLCTNGTMIKSTNYTELIQTPPSTGVKGTAVKKFDCVYHKRKYLKCNWERSAQMPANSQQNLYYWNVDLEQTEECPKYITSSGVRKGCDFTGLSLPDFTDINFCVNGSSPEGPLEPTFISLQIQNHVKPETPEKLHLQTGPDMQVELGWDHPVGRIPAHCLEWEVVHNQDGVVTEQILTKQKSLTLPSLHGKRNCFRVRSKLHKYCAEKGFWSDWSPPTCNPEIEEVAPEREWNMIPTYVYIAVATIAILVLLLCVGAVLKVRKSRQVKKPDSLFTTLFAQNPVLTVEQA